MNLLDDLRTLALAIPSERTGLTAAAYSRIRVFIQTHQPWYPPPQEGFGPWIEYDPGKDKGPRVNEVVMIITATDRKEKRVGRSYAAGAFAWCASSSTPIVAYCVNLDEAQS